MNTIKCSNCGEEIEISSALQGQIEEQALKAEHQKHAAELEKIKAEAAAQAKQDTEAALTAAKKRLAGEKEILQQEAAAEIELAKKKLESELLSQQKKSASEQELLVKSLKEDAEHAKENSTQLTAQLTELTQALREEKKAKENAELEMQKKLSIEQDKIREEITKSSDEKYRLLLAEQEKKLSDTKKALEEAQRKAAQGSQQLQGEIMELDLEEALGNAFRDDDIEPVAKGVRGGDIKHTVKSTRGTACGVILWEIKRTKNWTDGWIPKLKEDLRNERANIPVIVTEIMPKQVTEDMGHLNGVWVCKPALTIILGTLLRKGLLDVGMQKALGENRGTKADALFNFVTSHEFVQQVESMVETYQDMALQISKEKIAFQKIWAQREAQAQSLLLNTANIIGSMQGHIGQASMPKIKGLELMEAGAPLDELTDDNNTGEENTLPL
ncbi:MAG TPA: DUF2130 domain-containing protein, partial [Candidatus Saccharimonadales bacterium]|jgi:hypothetical protein|nr:DUF2130 domain-containing protein [Candidatus Saccharimonadales bacterium]